MSTSTHRTRPRWGLLVAGIVAVAVVAAVAVMLMKPGALPSVGSIRSDASYRVGLAERPSSLDIRTNDERAAQQVLMDNVYETLLSYDAADDGAVTANLVARWTATDDGLRYTFHLRDGLTFADGSTLDAGSAVSSLQAIITNGYSGRDDLAAVAKVERVDDTAFAITLRTPDPALPLALTGPAGIVYDTKGGDDYETQSHGSGPFTVAGTDGDTVTLERNANYWGTAPKAQRIVLQYFADDNAMADALADGSLDLALPGSAAVADRLAGNDALRVTHGMSTRKTLVALNNAGDSPFSDEQVRKLTRLAIDAAGIAGSQPDAQAQLSGPISQLMPGYVDLDSLFPYDPQQALSMRWYFPAGYFAPFTLLADEDHASLGATIVDQVAAAGLPISLETVDAQTLASRVDQGDYDCALIEMDDPRDYVRFVDGSAMFGYQDGEVQDAYRKAQAATDYATWREGLREVDRLVSEDAASAWLYTGRDWVAAKKQLKGVPQDLVSWRLPLDELDG